MAKIKVWYDREGDYLELATSRKKGHFKDVGNDIWERVDEKGHIIGFAIANFTPYHGEAPPVRAGRNGGQPEGNLRRPRPSGRGTGFTKRLSRRHEEVELPMEIAFR